MLLISAIKMIRTPLKHIRKDLIGVVFICHFLTGLLVVVQICIYTTIDLVDLLTEAVLSISIFVMYMYQKECLTFFTNKYVTETLNVLDNLVKDKNHQKIMFEHAHPMHKITGLQRLKLTELYTRYSYLLSGKFVIWICRKKNISSFIMAEGISKRNNLFFALYLSLIPIVLTIKFILNQTVDLDTIKLGRLSISGFFNLAELIITVLFLPRLVSFAFNFNQLYSFFGGNKQLFWVLAPKVFRRIIAGLLFVTGPTVSIYSSEESQSILIALIFSLFYLLFSFMMLYRFRPFILNLYEEAPIANWIDDVSKEKLIVDKNLNGATETPSHSS